MVGPHFSDFHSGNTTKIFTQSNSLFLYLEDIFTFNLAHT